MRVEQLRHIKIVWSSLQIVSQFPSLLARFVPANLVALCNEVWFASLSPLGSLGLACVSPSLSGFAPRLRFATITPMLAALALVASYGGPSRRV